MRGCLKKLPYKTLWIYMCLNIENNIIGKCNSCAHVHVSLLFRKTDAEYEIQFLTLGSDRRNYPNILIIMHSMRL